MAVLPTGMLSLTYHLAYDTYYRDLWMNGDYATCYAAFRITDPAEQAEIQRINVDLGTANEAQRNALVDEWMAMVGQDVKQSAANPKVLW